MKNLLILVAAFLSTSAAAAVIGPDQVQGQQQGQGQAQGQIQGQAQGQGQAQFANSNADSRARAQAYAASLTRSEANNSQALSVTPAPVTLTVNEAAIPERTTQRIEQGTLNVRSVPNVFGGNVYPTAPCMGSSTVGAAALGWGVSAGTSWADHECGKRETARSFQNLGLTNDAVAVLCSSEYAAVAPICKEK
ncbi:MAG: hypothetical protein ABFC77_15645 [Thermoguttaceae bacterium]